MGIHALLCILISLMPMLAGASYLLRPTEQRLAMMRPISLAGIFASLSGTTLGFINTLRMFWMDRPHEWPIVATATAESIVPMFVGFSSLMLAWLCIAIGMRRQS